MLRSQSRKEPHHFFALMFNMDNVVFKKWHENFRPEPKTYKNDAAS
jgi:hypothetical protein